MVAAHLGQDPETVQPGHDDIQQKQGQLTALGLDDGHCLQSVFRFNDVVFILQHIGQDGPVHFRVVHDQDLGADGFRFFHGGHSFM